MSATRVPALGNQRRKRRVEPRTNGSATAHFQSARAAIGRAGALPRPRRGDRSRSHLLAHEDASRRGCTRTACPALLRALGVTTAFVRRVLAKEARELAAAGESVAATQLARRAARIRGARAGTQRPPDHPQAELPFAAVAVLNTSRSCRRGLGPPACRHRTSRRAPPLQVGVVGALGHGLLRRAPARGAAASTGRSRFWCDA